MSVDRLRGNCVMINIISMDIFRERAKLHTRYGGPRDDGTGERVAQR